MKISVIFENESRGTIRVFEMGTNKLDAAMVEAMLLDGARARVVVGEETIGISLSTLADVFTYVWIAAAL